MKNQTPKQKYFQRKVNDLQTNIDRIIPTLLSLQEQYRHFKTESLKTAIEMKERELRKWKHQQHKYLPFCQF